MATFNRLSSDTNPSFPAALAANGAQHDDLLLSALEPVHGVNLELARGRRGLVRRRGRRRHRALFRGELDALVGGEAIEVVDGGSLADVFFPPPPPPRSFAAHRSCNTRTCAAYGAMTPTSPGPPTGATPPPALLAPRAARRRVTISTATFASSSLYSDTPSGARRSSPPSTSTNTSGDVAPALPARRRPRDPARGRPRRRRRLGRHLAAVKTRRSETSRGPDACGTAYPAASDAYPAARAARISSRPAPRRTRRGSRPSAGAAARRRRARRSALSSAVSTPRVRCTASPRPRTATRNVNPSKRSSPAPTHVAQTTSARDSTSALAAFSSAKACLRAAVPREERSPRAASRSAAAFFPGVVSAACEGVRGRVRWS